jgi:hypothetical protein
MGASDVYVRFLGVKKTSSGVARQSVVLTEKGSMKLRFGIGGRGIRAVHVADEFSTVIILTNSKKGYQVKAARVKLAEGKNLVSVRTVAATGRIDTFRLLIMRVPKRGRPPMICFFKKYRFAVTEFVRGMVLGYGMTKLYVQTSAMQEPYLLEGGLIPSHRSHEFVTQVDLKQDEKEVCFLAKPKKGAVVKKCLGRCQGDNCSAKGGRVHALIVALGSPKKKSPVEKSYNFIRDDAKALGKALEHKSLRSIGNVRVLLPENLNVKKILDEWQRLLAGADYNDLMIFAYMGPVKTAKDADPFALPVKGSSGRKGIPLNLQSIIDMVSQSKSVPRLLLLIDGILEDGSGAGMPKLSARQPVCFLAASKKGESNIRHKKLGGSLFAQSIAAKLRSFTAAPETKGLRLDQLKADLLEQSRLQSEGSQNPVFKCLKYRSRDEFVFPP